VVSVVMFGLVQALCVLLWPGSGCLNSRVAHTARLISYSTVASKLASGQRLLSILKMMSR
jgi:hypothetical protein